MKTKALIFPFFNLPLICLLLINLIGKAQSKKYSPASFDFMYGQKLLSHKTFNGAFNDLKQLKLNWPVSYVGIGITGHFITLRGEQGDHDGNLYYAQILPQVIRLNDTLNANISGFNFGFTVEGIDLFSKSRVFDAIICFGANTGRYKLSNAIYSTQKNPYFSPKIALLPRFVIGKIILLFNIAYETDISSKNWRPTYFSKLPKNNLEKTSVTGLTIMAGIGIALE